MNLIGFLHLLFLFVIRMVWWGVKHGQRKKLLNLNADYNNFFKNDEMECSTALVYGVCYTLCWVVTQVQPLSLEELLAKKKAEEEAEAKVRHR